MTTVLFDKDFILDPNKWPARPLLPLTRNKSDRECGFIMENDKIIVYVAYIFRLKPGIPIIDQVKDKKQYTYATVDELLADGWEVD